MAPEEGDGWGREGENGKEGRVGKGNRGGMGGKGERSRQGKGQGLTVMKNSYFRPCYMYY